MPRQKQGVRIQETEYRIKNNEIVLDRCIIIRILSSLDSLTNPVAPMNRDFRFTAVIHGECSRCRVSGYPVSCILYPAFCILTPVSKNYVVLSIVLSCLHRIKRLWVIVLSEEQEVGPGTTEYRNDDSGH